MSDESVAGAEAGPIDIVQIPAVGESMGASEAGKALAAFRQKRQETATAETPQAKAAPEPAAPEPATPESADEADAAPQETEATGETQATDPVEEPPLELPRSWTKDRAEHWAKLDRGTQEFLLDHDRKASAEVRRVQNEAAEKLKGLTAKEQAVEQARTQYETALPALLETIQQQQNVEFSDIRTIEDVQKLAATDWPRYVMWDAKQKQIAAVQQQVQQATQRQTLEKQQKLSEFEQTEAKAFAEKVPEFADPKKKAELQNQAIALLKDHLGFSDQELGEIYNSDKGLSLRDHRTQLLLLDGIRYREAKASSVKPTPKPVPPVQRPGVSQPRGAAVAADVQNLSKRLDQSTGVNALRTAAALVQARRASR